MGKLLDDKNTFSTCSLAAAKHNIVGFIYNVRILLLEQVLFSCHTIVSN
jgi:hypothetical protein